MPSTQGLLPVITYHLKHPSAYAQKINRSLHREHFPRVNDPDSDLGNRRIISFAARCFRRRFSGTLAF
jgi:hypothetical protein